MKRKLLFIFISIFFSAALVACPVCEKQQPKLLRGITHGAGPQSNWDWVIISVVAIITLLTFVYSTKFILFPGEKNSSHIKHSILLN